MISQLCPDDPTQIGRASGCQGCPGQTYCQRVSTGDDEPAAEALQCRIAVIRYKLIVMSGKGGVGKSTVASQLAIGLAAKGFKVAILDLDLCGPSIPKLFGCESAEVVQQPWGWIPVKSTVNGVFVMSIGFLSQNKDAPVMWRGPRKTQLVTRFLRDTYWGILDYLIIDTPPGTSDEHLSVVAALSSSLALSSTSSPSSVYSVLVTTPQDLATQIVRKHVSFCKKLKLPILGIVENMSGFVCPCCNEVYSIFEEKKGGNSGGQGFTEEYGIPLAAKIPLDPIVSSSADLGKTVVYAATNTSSAAAKAFAQLVDWVREHTS